MRTFQVKMHDEAASVGTRLEMMIERHVGSAGHRYCFEIAADASVNEHRLAFNFPAIKAEKAMPGFA